MLVDHLLFMEREPQARDGYQRLPEERRAWSPAGVTGVFRQLVPDGGHGHGTASVHAEFAHWRGWPEPDRVLDARASTPTRARSAAARPTAVRYGPSSSTLFASPPGGVYGTGSPFSR